MECSVCYSSYDAEINKPHTPIMMNCGHTLCKSCFETIIRRDTQNCPFSCPQPMGRELRANYSLMSLVENSNNPSHNEAAVPPIRPFVNSVHHSRTSGASRLNFRFNHRCVTDPDAQQSTGVRDRPAVPQLSNPFPSVRVPGLGRLTPDVHMRQSL